MDSLPQTYSSMDQTSFSDFGAEFGSSNNRTIEQSSANSNNNSPGSLPTEPPSFDNVSSSTPLPPRYNLRPQTRINYCELSEPSTETTTQL